MNSSLVLRIIYDLLLLIVVAFMPWWISFPIAIISAVAYKNFFEIIFVGLWIDSVQFNGSLHSISFFFLILSALIYLSAGRLRRLIHFIN